MGEKRGEGVRYLDETMAGVAGMPETWSEGKCGQENKV